MYAYNVTWFWFKAVGFYPWRQQQTHVNPVFAKVLRKIIERKKTGDHGKQSSLTSLFILLSAGNRTEKGKT
jgi:hypothetical protein